MRPQLLGTLSACRVHSNHKNVLSDVKKGGTKAAFFVKLTTELRGWSAHRRRCQRQ
jgi:hypothetical protein